MQTFSIPENILLFIAGFGIIQGFLLSGLLYFHPRSNKSVNIFLALYIAAISIVMAGPFIINSFSWKSSFITQPLPLLIGPLLYLYVKGLRQTINLRKAVKHFISYPLYFIIAYFWFRNIHTDYNSSTIPVHIFLNPGAIIVCGIPYLHLLVYYFMSRRELTNYQKSINSLLSETVKTNSNWIKWLINGFAFIVLTGLVIYALIIKYPQHFTVFYLITMSIVTPYIYITTYKGITQSGLWLIEVKPVNEVAKEQSLVLSKIEKTVTTKNKNLKQDEGNKKIEEIVAKITAAMEEEKLYQEPELTLQNIADKLQFPTYQVSQAINDGMNKSFYDLINGYRVDEAKLLLLNPKNRNFTILSVGFEAGFNSKTTFNTVFKKYTGMTPTEFREQEKEKELAIRA